MFKLNCVMTIVTQNKPRLLNSIFYVDYTCNLQISNKTIKFTVYIRSLAELCLWFTCMLALF